MQHCALQAILFVPAGCIFVTIQLVLLYFFQLGPRLLLVALKGPVRFTPNHDFQSSVQTITYADDMLRYAGDPSRLPRAYRSCSAGAAPADVTD